MPSLVSHCAIVQVTAERRLDLCVRADRVGAQILAEQLAANIGGLAGERDDQYGSGRHSLRLGELLRKIAFECVRAEVCECASDIEPDLSTEIPPAPAEGIVF